MMVSPISELNTHTILEEIISVKTAAFNLCALVTRPQNLTSKIPLVLIPNSGLVHHVGTCRFSVKLARELAIKGYIACRMDLTSLGDSSARFDHGSASDSERSIEELKTMADHLFNTYGNRPLIMYGLCSGSQNGFKFAVQDQRVVGLFGVDHFGFRNWSFLLVHYFRQSLRMQPWLNRLNKILGRDKKQTIYAQSNVDLGDVNFIWEYPSKASVEDGYRVLVARGVAMTYIYTGDWFSEYNHRLQFFLMHSSVDFKGLAQIYYQPEMSHILAEPASQNFVVQQVLHFLRGLTYPQSD